VRRRRSRSAARRSRSPLLRRRFHVTSCGRRSARP
jgi:hypothetical protein